MTNTLRLHKNLDSDGSFNMRSGVDLSDYREQLVHDRNSRTLTLRRIKKPTIQQFLTQGQTNTLESPLIDTKNFPFLDINYAILQLTNGNTSSLSEFLNNLTVCATTTPRLAMNLAQAPEIAEPFADALSASYSEEINIQLITTMIAIFPIAGENRVNFVDAGLTTNLFEFLSSTSLPLLEVSIALVDVMTDYSTYANDSILCLGVHQFLIEIAQNEYNEPLTLQALDALKRIFALTVNAANEKPHKIDVITLESSVELMVPLLDLSSTEAVNSALMCFVALTDQMSALVFNLYDLGLFPKIVNFLTNPDLVSAALPLIGNMSVCHATHVETLLQCGLFEILMKLINTEYTSDVFWVLSNLVESVPHKTVELFDEHFIEKTIDIAIRSSFDVKKEATFFLATLAMFVATDNLAVFMNVNLLDLMLEMLNYNFILIVIRSLDALIRLAKVLETKTESSQFEETFHSEEVIAILNGLLSEDNAGAIKERVTVLLSCLEVDTPSLLAS